MRTPKFYYFEYEKNHDDQFTTPIQRIRRFNFRFPVSNCWIVGSYNGLVCFVGYHESVCICNPITKQYVVLPTIKNDPDPDIRYNYSSFGFGWVASTNAYKVVSLRVLIKEVVEVHIYTLGSGDAWRNLGKFNHQFGTYPWETCIFANGALYWPSRELNMITTFDLTEEKFGDDLSPPPLLPDSNWYENKIGVLDGLLFFADCQVVEDTKFYDVWLLKMKNGNHDIDKKEGDQSLVWSKEFRVGDIELLAVTKSHGVLAFNRNYLNIYDTKASTSKRLVDFKEEIHQVFPHKNTLISLKELGEEDAKVMELIQIEETESHDQPSIVGGE